MKNVISNILQVTLICSAVAAIILSIIYIEQNHSKPKTNEFSKLPTHAKRWDGL